MDSQVQADGRLLEIVDDEWRKEKLPEDDVAVPYCELPDPEADNGNLGESLREQENKWTELALGSIVDSGNIPATGSSASGGASSAAASSTSTTTAGGAAN